MTMRRTRSLGTRPWTNGASGVGAFALLAFPAVVSPGSVTMSERAEVRSAWEASAQRTTAAPDSVAEAIRRQLSDTIPYREYAASDWHRVQSLYKARQYRPIWTDSSTRAPSIRSRQELLAEALAGAPEQGLDASAYLGAQRRAALNAAERDSLSVDALARVDVVHTAAFVAYATDLLTGQIDPRTVTRAWHIDPHEVDVDSALAESLRRDSFQEALLLLRPQDRDYGLLVQELAKYRRIVADGGWPTVPAMGILRPGETRNASALGLLLARLNAEGYSPMMALAPAATAMEAARNDTAPALGTNASVMYDRALAGAVAAYQRHHALVVDSIVGPNTLASMNRSARFRLQQIAANLERHRWMPRERGLRYVVVNVPAFRLRAYSEGREVLGLNVVVGAEYDGRSTPVFSDSMAYVVFRPYWNVPAGIASRELWPKQRADPGYFGRHGYETVNASWGTYVRQKPAPDNALGRVKFIFPNDYAIYLHDTPAQTLFAEHVRAFSHGCIRVEHPDQLAEFVLGPQGWDIDRVRAAMTEGPDDRRVNLERRLPVYIVYFTTYGREGALYFGNDIYDRDDALVGAVQRVRVESESLSAQRKEVR